MLIFWIGFALVMLFLALIKHWKGVLITLFVFWVLAKILPDPPPDKTADSQVVDTASISIDVPVYLEKYDVATGWPVTFGNRGPKAYTGYVWVVCTVTQTVADAVGAMVMGIRQYPYIMSGNVTILSNSITTAFLQQAGENDIEKFSNVNKCGLYGTESAATEAASHIDTKWIQVTPYGARQAGKLGMNIPYSSNVKDYKNPW